MKMKCPKCGSERIATIKASYPKSYECKDCKYMWLKAPQALIDE